MKYLIECDEIKKKQNCPIIFYMKIDDIWYCPLKNDECDFRNCTLERQD